jgi:hypothetical protein
MSIGTPSTPDDSTGTPSTNDPNPTGTGSQGQKSAGGEVLSALIAGAVALAGALIKDLATALQGRSIVGSISNNTKFDLQHVSDHHDHGGFKQTPPQDIPPTSAASFSSETTGVLTGTQGGVTYAGEGFTVTFDWDNPELGANSANASVDGPNASRILVAYAAGSGNEGATMQYWLFPHPDYYVKATLGSKAQDGTLSLASLRPQGTPISVRDLVSHP